MLDPSLRRSAQKVGTQKVGTQKVQRDTKFIYFNPATPRASNSMFSSKSETATFTAYHHTALRFEAKKFAAMPTLVWVRRPESGADAAARGGSATRREAAVPDPVVSAAAAAVPDGAATSVSTVHADPVYVAFPAVSTKRPADGGEKKKRKSAEAVTDAKKKSKATSERDLPTGVRKLRSGKYESRITWGDKTHYIGVFDTPEQASAAHLSVMKDRDDVELSALGAHEVNALFEAAKKKALEAVGESKATSKRDLPQGVHSRKSPGKFVSMISWGNKVRYIGTFDTPEQASAAHLSVMKDRDDVELSALGAHEVNALFEAAKKKALEAVGESKATSKRDLPQGVHSRKSPGKFVSMISWGNKVRYIGTFDTPEQASAAHLSVMKDRDDAELSALGADEVDTLFDAAKQRAVKAEGGLVRRKKKLPRVGGFVLKRSKRDLSQGFYKTSSGKFISVVRWGGKLRDIGTFDSPEQASAAFMSVKKDLDDAKLSGFGSDEVDDIFNTAKEKALETVQAMMDSNEYGDEH